ncbi:unnamed protein product, partial [Amoebophrya sp. A120]|eukprot:GSA120T00009118001.1
MKHTRILRAQHAKMRRRRPERAQGDFPVYARAKPLPAPVDLDRIPSDLQRQLSKPPRRLKPHEVGGASGGVKSAVVDEERNGSPHLLAFQGNSTSSFLHSGMMKNKESRAGPRGAD